MASQQADRNPPGTGADGQRQVPLLVPAGLVAVACVANFVYERRGEDLGGWQRIGHGAAALFFWVCVGSFAAMVLYLRIRRRASAGRLVLALVLAPGVAIVAMNVFTMGGGLLKELFTPKVTPTVTSLAWWQRRDGADDLELGVTLRTKTACTLSFSATVMARSTRGSTRGLDPAVTTPIVLEVPSNTAVTARERFHLGPDDTPETPQLAVECAGIRHVYDQDTPRLDHAATNTFWLPLPPPSTPP